MKFKDIIGQKSVIKALESAWINQKISHAYLFEGPLGIGKKTVAKVFAQRLMCSENMESVDACGQCENCTMFQAGTHPDFHFFSTDGETVKVDEIRDLFEDVHITPHYSFRKVYIIDNADKMNVQAQNCILKTLEEPPENIVIILLADNPEALLETVLSRVIKYSFKRYRKEEIMTAVENYSPGICGYSPDFIFAFSDGIIGKAVDICSNEDFRVLRDMAFNIIEDIESGDPVRRINAAESILETKKVKLMIEFFMSYYRDLLVTLTDGKEVSLINLDRMDIIQKRRPGLGKNSIIRIFGILKESLYALSKNVNESLLVESLVYKLQEEYVNG